MKKYVLFENKGLLDKMGLFMIGASSKREDDSKIGRFGSGFKYSLSKILRDNLNIVIYSGTTEIPIATEPFTLRGKEFQAIKIDGERTSLTTDMGPDWQWWQILRELWCNAIDEGGEDMRIVDEELIDGREDHTRVFLEINQDIQTVIDDWDNYFTHDREDLVLQVPGFKVFRSRIGKERIYRKGILVHQSNQNSLFDYEHDDIDINEERVITSEWQTHHRIAKQLSQHASTDIARIIMKNACSGNNVEKSFDFDYCVLNDNWDAAAKTFDGLVLEGATGYYLSDIKSDNWAILSTGLAKRLLQKGVYINGLMSNGKRQEWYPLANPSPKQSFLLSDVIKVLQNEFNYIVEFPIEIVRFEDENKLGQALMSEKKILLSENLFNMGKRQLALCIMEECEHIKHRLEDETRTFQNHLFNMWLATLEEKAGYFL